MTEYHNIEPVVDAESKILILGSFPSVKSRECQFYYGHPQNRFWKVLAVLLKTAVPVSIDEKKNLLLEHHIAVWDVIASCEIKGSSDSSIQKVVPNAIDEILKGTKITRIFTNGGTAHTLYMKHIFPKTQIEPIKLPSTSPANATYSLERLVKDWEVIQKY